MSFQETLPVELITSLQEKPISPNVTVNNPLQVKVFINAIQIILDAYFISSGSILILAGQTVLFDSKKTPLTQSRNIPLVFEDVELQRHEKIKFFFWNEKSLDPIEISALAYVTFSNKPKITTNNIEIADFQTLLNEKDEPEVIFEKKLYSNETLTKIFDTHGYKKLIINMSATSIINPNIESTAGGVTNSQNIVDGNLGTYANANVPNTKTAIVDFESIAIRKPSVKLSTQKPSNQSSTTYELRLFVSSNGVDFDLVDIMNGTNGSNESIHILTDIEQSFRFMKVQIVNLVTNNPNVLIGKIYEMYDANNFGGVASLSFEELDIAINEYSTIISASEIGTVANGQKIKRQIGNVGSIASGGKTYFLPSTQTGLRIKLSVSGNIETSVSVRRLP